MDNYSQKKCGFCGENIPAEADRCPYCGSILEVTVDAQYGMPEQQQGGTDEFYGANTAGEVQENGADQPQEAQIPPVADGNQFTGNNDPAAGNQNNAYGNVYGPATQQSMGQRPEYDGQRQDYGQRPYYPRQQQQPPVYRSNSGKPPMSNGLKVFLTMLFTLVPGIGQLAGIITAIVFMSSSGDDDRRSFGVAILVASLAMFVLSCLGCFVLYSIGESFPIY